jgi:hypothetical protein
VEISVWRDHDLIHGQLSRLRIRARMRAGNESLKLFLTHRQRRDAPALVFLTCTKNIELTGTDFTRRVTFAPSQERLRVTARFAARHWLAASLGERARKLVKDRKARHEIRGMEDVSHAVFGKGQAAEF